MVQINADFSARIVVHADKLDWQASPMPGVERRMLDRIGGEVARATTIVRYAPKSRFSAHTHDGGEEFIVLDGVFQDEHGDFPAGSYIRNPPTSSHTPGSDDGCTILVKLWQFDPADRTHIRIDMEKSERLPDPARPGVTATPLFQDARETVRLEEWSANAKISIGDSGGAEFFVMQGSFEQGDDSLVANSWLRLPPGFEATAHTGPKGAKVWVKTRHLRFVEAPSTAR